MSQEISNLTHPLFRFATRLDGIITLLFGLFLTLAASGIIDIITVDVTIPFYVVGGILTVYGLFFLLIVSNQKSISISYVLFYGMFPRGILTLLILVDIFGGFVSTSTEMKILEGTFVAAFIAIVALELYSLNLWRNQKFAAWGFDMVSFLDDKSAIVGNPAIHYHWNGQTWFFASEEHKNLFEDNPEKYAPANDGFCSLGRSLGSDFDANPRNWDIIDGKVYFNSTMLARAVWKAQGAKHD